MPSQITYRYLFPGTEPSYDELSRAELVGVRQAENEEGTTTHAVGEVIKVSDARHGDEERLFKVVSVGNPTRTRFVDDPSTATDNLNVYVTDAE